MTESQKMPHHVLLDRVVRVLKSAQSVRAAFLRGPLSDTRLDTQASLDLVVVAAGDDESLLELGREAIRATGGALWVTPLSPNPPRLRALFNGPVRLDIALANPGSMLISPGLRVLFDYDNLLQSGTGDEFAADLLPEHVAQVCDEFWWNVFDSIGQLKRGQLWMALSLLDACRANLAQIMRWRRDPERPAARLADLERHLSAEDQQALAQTLAGYDLRAIADALLSAADAFDPAGREVANRVGAVYPSPLAHETKAYFIREFWALLAPGPAISA